MMKDILIVGLVGLVWQLVPSEGRELITPVLFALMIVTALARTPRDRDILIICGVGLLWEMILADSRDWITFALFALPPLRLSLYGWAARKRPVIDASRRVAWNAVGPARLPGWLLDRLAGAGRRIKTREFVFEFVGALGMLGLGIGVAVYLTRGLGVSRGVIGYGAVSYALGAVGFKGLLYSDLVVPVLHERLSPVWLATAQGFISAISELGAAALFFWPVIPGLSFPELIGFGAAAGIVEALFLPLMSIGGINILSGTPVERTGVERTSAEQWQDAGATPVAVMVFPLVERGLTMALHTSSRALVYAAMVLGNVVPALLAVSLFAAVDGTAYYALLKQWKVLSFAVGIRFHALVALSVAILTLAFWQLHGLLW
jgi:hypothetical protein